MYLIITYSIKNIQKSGQTVCVDELRQLFYQDRTKKVRDNKNKSAVDTLMHLIKGWKGRES